MAPATRPAPPINGSSAEITAWLNGPALNAPELSDDIRFSVVLSALNVPAGRQDIDELWDGTAHISWLGGPAVGPLTQWPQRRDGKKLAHVASLHLGEVADVIEDQQRTVWGPGMPDRNDPAQSLPDSGVLEVFHDCEASGYEADDGPSGAWHVRWVQTPDGGIVDAPDDAEPPTDVCQVVIPSASFSLRPPADNMDLPDAAFNRVLDAHDAVHDAWQSFYKAGREKVFMPLSHVYGHGWKGITEISGILNDVLPLQEGDEHVLLLDLEGWTHLEGWFGDAGHLEVWMRRSDLAARAFDKAWCLIRMG
ncbi:hypothetical protein D477_003058 [Arthrobacter crystallopoietes BAB-32]|uniref:DUF1963 domain-containing protein n=1 Tax=Arthrobacter crystallopoietes BAB-32 TaxID=1246476 RepID=N1V2R6_9MICC|nr:DUF1963 domain-containing protein [Arthrobacter crystallopoietes]EMY35640.1 hypothetical protein D477_003058 [Arthrobacter crystallopoietes BAB-32]